MSKRPRTSAEKTDDGAVLNRPFNLAIWKKAERIAEAYQIVIWFEDGEWYGRGLELPLAMSDGSTPDDCVAHVREAMALTVASMLEDNQAPPRAGVQRRKPAGSHGKQRANQWAASAKTIATPAS